MLFGVLLIAIGASWLTGQWGFIMPSVLIAWGMSLVLRRPRRWQSLPWGWRWPSHWHQTPRMEGDDIRVRFHWN
jgi:hypothetical protein